MFTVEKETPLLLTDGTCCCCCERCEENPPPKLNPADLPICTLYHKYELQTQEAQSIIWFYCIAVNAKLTEKCWDCIIDTALSWSCSFWCMSMENSAFPPVQNLVESQQQKKKNHRVENACDQLKALATRERRYQRNWNIRTAIRNFEFLSFHPKEYKVEFSAIEFSFCYSVTDGSMHGKYRMNQADFCSTVSNKIKSWQFIDFSY